VTDGIYQVRGLDLSIMTIVEGDTGVLVIDPLISTECAAAALALYREHRGDRPVTGLLYTHSHADHFGGARGVVSADDVASGRVPVLAPDGFLAHAVSENVYAGGAMTRRATYMYGALLPKGPAGQVGAGLGQTTSTAFERGDFRWVAEVVNHLVFAAPENGEAKELQAGALEQLAYGAENGTWRNFFLTGARELRHGSSGTAATVPPDFIVNLSNAQLFDALAIQIDGPRAGDRRITLHWRFTDTGEEYACGCRRPSPPGRYG
jgi:alkyl sulfatase BDS1-like metallo-beta-lactamase superfamily hydrolase